MMKIASPRTRRAPAFKDRREAGAALLECIEDRDTSNAVVIGLARGGVEVADVIARRLNLPLDALAVRKIGHPLQPEFAVGAVAPGGIVYLRDEDGFSRDEIVAVVGDALQRVVRLDRRLHAGRPPLDPAGITCILVDDGLATGATMIAACRWAHAHAAARVVAAVPVGATESLAMLESEADSVVCAVPISDLGSVGRCYRSFEPVEDGRVIELISTAPLG
jgi:putative phosphoribosyl transferase